MSTYTSEHDIQNSIRLKLSEMGYFTERVNVGSGYLIPKPLYDKLMNHLRHHPLGDELAKIRFFNTGAVKGRSDLSAIKDGKISFIEVKNETGKPSSEQLNFIKQMREKYGCNAGIARSPEEAVNIVTGRT